MIFASDNWSGASDRVIEAVARAARDGGPAYGKDELTRAVEGRFSEIFERDVVVFFVATGTAANALGLSAYGRPGGVVFACQGAHVLFEEAGATEFFSGGTRVVGVDGTDGKMTADGLRSILAAFPEGSPHQGQPVAVSVTEITELGTAYSTQEIAAIAAVAKARDMAVHMDGARFAGAVAALGASPAEITWKAGVDVLSFGGTKNGCIAAEAVVFFNPAEARDFAFARQRAGHTFSKGWFAAAQFNAYLEGGHWLDLARHANRMAGRLAAAIEQSKSARLAVKPAANEIFAVIARLADKRLREAGAAHYEWPTAGLGPAARPGAGESLVRLVTSFRTRPEEVDRFAAILNAA